MRLIERRQNTTGGRPQKKTLDHGMASATREGTTLVLEDPLGG
jgi:hypothetical protein